MTFVTIRGGMERLQSIHARAISVSPSRARSVANRGLQRHRLRFRPDAHRRFAGSSEDVQGADGGDEGLPRLRALLRDSALDLARALHVLPPLRGPRRIHA